MTSVQRKFAFVLFCGLLSASFAKAADTAAVIITDKENVAEPELRLNPNSLDLIRTDLGFETVRARVQHELWQPDSENRILKVAILDKGFRDWEARKGISLPKNTRFFPGPFQTANASPHGTLMAEIMTSMVAGPEWANPNMIKLPFELLLINVAGFTNFRAAIQTLIDEKVDIVLYSEVWELGGNGDGGGFINREVSKALDNGVIWINAAGNFNGRSFETPVKIGEKNLAQLPDEKSSLKVVCEPPKGETECLMKATLTWNDFQDDWNKGTLKDLDLALYDSKFKVLQASILKQVDKEGDAGVGETKYPREALASSLKKGTYYLRARSRSSNWTENDRLRLLVDGDSLSVPSASRTESLQNPADNARVITIGGADAERSSVSRKLAKPELIIRSSVMEKLGKEFRGSSNAAAIAAAGAILVKYENSDLDRDSLLENMSGTTSYGEASWGWNALGLAAPMECVQAVDKQTGVAAIDKVLNDGGHWVETPLGPKILVDVAVTELGSKLSIDAPKQSLWVSEEGFKVISRGQWTPEMSNSVEVLQRPQGTSLCNESGGQTLFQIQ